MINLFKVFTHEDATKNVQEVLKSGYLAEGPRVLELETALAKEFGCEPKNVVTTNSCTSAIHLCLSDVTIQENVISTPLTCAATNMAVVQAGKKIVWSDIDNTLNLDLDYAEQLLSESCNTIVWVNWGGNSIDLGKVVQIADRYRRKYGQRLKLIEDAAHCWIDVGYKINLDVVKHYKCYSTQAIKYLTTGDGGFIIASDSDQDWLRKLRWFGLDRSKGGFRSGQDIDRAGFKSHMNDVAASIGLGNLPHVKENVDKQKKNAQYLRANLQNFVKIPTESEYGHSYWLFTILVENRPKFIEGMLAAGVEVNQVHQRNDKLSCFKEFSSMLPYMDSIENKYVCIPVHWGFTEDNLKYIVEKVKENI